jgi:hypothetical protein
MNEEPSTDRQSKSAPQPSKPSWSDADHPGIDYQKKRSKFRTVGLAILALIGASLIVLGILFGACVLGTRL